MRAQEGPPIYPGCGEVRHAGSEDKGDEEVDVGRQNKCIGSHVMAKYRGTGKKKILLTYAGCVSSVEII